MAYASVHSNGIAGFFAPAANVFAMLRVAWQRSRTYVTTHNELSALSARELADLGINRGMISRLAYEAAYGRDD